MIKLILQEKNIFIKSSSKIFSKKYKFNRKQGFEININKLMVQNLSKNPRKYIL